MDANDLERFQRNYQRIRESNAQLDEANTRNTIVNQFLMAIGWNFVPSEIQSEFPVKMGSGSHRVDYCLKLDGSPAAFVEAKPLGWPLTSEELAQTLSYGRVQFVRWCVITNGVDVVVLDSQAKTKRPEDAALFRFSLAQLKDARNYLEALSPEGLRQNRLDAIADEIASQRGVLVKFEATSPHIRSALAASMKDLNLGAGAEQDLIEGFITRVRSAIVSGPGGGTAPSAAPAAQAMTPSVPPATAFRRISRMEIPALVKGVVALFPSNPDGLTFLEKYRAWGFVGMTGKPDYCALYITKPDQRVRFIAKVASTIKASEWLARQEGGTSEASFTTYNPAKQVVQFANHEIFEITDPIPWTPGDPILQGMRYVTLESFRTAKRVGELQLAEF